MTDKTAPRKMRNVLGQVHNECPDCRGSCVPVEPEPKHDWSANTGDKPWTCKLCFFYTANLRHIENGYCRHLWVQHQWPVCERCGVVQNKTNIEKPCIGVVRIETRNMRDLRGTIHDEGIGCVHQGCEPQETDTDIPLTHEQLAEKAKIFFKPVEEVETPGPQEPGMEQTRELPNQGFNEIVDDKEAVRFEKDGDKWCAHRLPFTNMMEMETGFGDTPMQALVELIATETAASSSRAIPEAELQRVAREIYSSGTRLNPVEILAILRTLEKK